MKKDNDTDDFWMSLDCDNDADAATQEGTPASAMPVEEAGEDRGRRRKRSSSFARINAHATDDDKHVNIGKGRGALRKVIIGDMLNDPFVRNQIWVILLIVLFMVIYIAIRYQCQQDLIAIDKLEIELKDAKYRALSSSSELTEKLRESHILNILKHSPDSALHTPELPPFIIQVPNQ